MLGTATDRACAAGTMRVGEGLHALSTSVEWVSHNERSCTDATCTTTGVVQ